MGQREVQNGSQLIGSAAKKSYSEKLPREKELNLLRWRFVGRKSKDLRRSKLSPSYGKYIFWRDMRRGEKKGFVF